MNPKLNANLNAKGKEKKGKEKSVKLCTTGATGLITVIIMGKIIKAMQRLLHLTNECIRFVDGFGVVGNGLGVIVNASV